MKTIGVIGLGLLGSAIAARLAQKGVQVAGYDIDPDALADFRSRGGRDCNSASQVFHSAETIILSLPEDLHVDEVLKKCLHHLRPGQFILDTTTGDPGRSAQRGRELAEKKVQYLDCTVAGSSEMLRAGTALLLVGGDAQAYGNCLPILELLSRKSFLVGPVGDGSRMKLVHNLVLGLHRAVLAEGLAFGRSLGLDPQTILEVLMQSPAASDVMRHKGGKMIHHEFKPQARMSQHAKDVKLILDLGEKNQQRLPLTQLHLQLLQGLVERGLGDLDNCAIIKAFE